MNFHHAMRNAFKATGLGLVYLECKIPLKADSPLFVVAKLMSAANPGEIENRNIVFYDTPGRGLLKTNHILRKRYNVFETEITYKARGKSLLLPARQSKISMPLGHKFKVEAVAEHDGYHLLYSNNETLDDMPRDATPVNKPITESLMQLGHLFFGHGLHGKANVGLWSLGDKPLIGEYAFQVHCHNPSHVHRVERFYLDAVRKLRPYLEAGKTKTSVAYNCGE